MRVGQSFAQGCSTHWGAIGVIAGVCVALCHCGWVARGRDLQQSRKVDAWLAGGLLAICLAVQVRYLMPDRLRWSWSLPLQVCNVAAIAAPVAIWTQARSARIVLHHFALGICSIALIAPMLHEGFARPDFWLFWFYHGGITVAAVYDYAVNDYRPTWRDWGWSALAIATYVVSVFGIDLVLHANYGFLGNDPHDTGLVLAFGPWPGRVLWLGAAAMLTTAMLSALGQLNTRLSSRSSADRPAGDPRTLPLRPAYQANHGLQDAA